MIALFSKLIALQVLFYLSTALLSFLILYLFREHKNDNIDDKKGKAILTIMSFSTFVLLILYSLICSSIVNDFIILNPRYNRISFKVLFLIFIIPIIVLKKNQQSKSEYLRNVIGVIILIPLLYFLGLYLFKM